MRDRNFHRGDFRGEFRGDYRKYRHHGQRHGIMFGFIVILVGVVLMLHTMGLISKYNMEDSWPIILIIIGGMIGIRSGFRRNAWWILVLIGVANLISPFTIMGRSSTDFAVPALVILAGLVIVFRPRRDRCYPHKRMESNINNDNTLNIDVTFGGKKEIVTSKDFKGGSITVTFAGSEINLTQADFSEPSVVLVCQVSFGGVEIVVPSHWEVQNEISPSFGSVEDERTIQTSVVNENKKILILRGNCSFGSIEIKSF